MQAGVSENRNAGAVTTAESPALMAGNRHPDALPPGLPPWLWIGGLVLLVLGLLPLLLR